MRIYELVFIVKPDLPEEETRAAVEQVRAALTEGGAAIDKVDEWGKRRLAYPVRGFADGHYVFMQYSAEDKSSLPREIERRLRVSDAVIKFMTVRIDEDLRRLEKLKKRREKRAARTPQRPARPAAPAAPSAPVPAQPGSAPAQPAAAQENAGNQETREKQNG